MPRRRKEAEQKVVTAQAESQQRILAGRGEGARILQEGLSEASVLLRKIQSFSDPRLYALSVVAQNLARSSQPLVPERVFIAGGGGSNGHGGRGPAGGPGGATAGSGLLGMLLSLLVAEKSGLRGRRALPGGNVLQDFADKVSKDAMENIQQAMAAGPGPVSNGSHNLNLEVADPAKPAAPTSPKAAKVDRPAGETTVVAGKT